MRRFYVTTPIYYVNDVPHLGTAYTTIVVDAVKRYHAMRGAEARMLTGTDEHGLKIQRQAETHGIEPKAFVDKMSAPFREAWPKLGVESDDFIRTTEPRHMSFVQEFWKRVERNGFLYEGEYEDWYCVGCESFKTEKELGPGNVCPVHNTPVERVQEKTFFFKLSAFEERLLSFYASHPEFIQPESRRNEVIRFVEGGLRDLSVSRTSFTWGVPVPGHPDHVMYVWFDALSNYRSALGPEDGDLARFWSPSARVVHVVGKDILRFHAVYWPAFLMAAGYEEAALPTQVFAHGFLTIDGRKMSKSLRNAVDPIRLADELGADVVRYHLLRAIAFGQDGDFDHAALLERYNADLGKNLGNLLSRTLGLCSKLTDAKTPAYANPTELESELARELEQSSLRAAHAWDELAPHRALEATWALASATNQYVDRAAPWATAKAGDQERTGTILATMLESLRVLSVLIAPAMPDASKRLREQLGLTPVAPGVGVDMWPKRFDPRPAGQALGKAAPLFPTLDEASTKALLERLVPAEAEAAKPAPADAKAAAPPAPGGEGASEAIDYDAFCRVDLRAGRVVSAERIPKKDKLLKLAVDLGESEPRTIVAGLALTFSPESLVDKRVVVVANLEPRKFGKGLVSHGMLLATGPSEDLRLASVPDDVPVGARLK